MDTPDLLLTKYSRFKEILNERELRLVLACESESLGRGGISMVSKKTGVSRSTLTLGLKELKTLSSLNSIIKKKVRKSGGGRKKQTQKYGALESTIEAIVNPYTKGDPMCSLLWSSKSVRKIAVALQEQGFSVSHETVAKILRSKDYRLQGNKKTYEGRSHEDRDKQFEHINKTSLDFLQQNAPVISVDCKKKELIGNYKNAGVEWHPKGQATEVNVYDFIDKEQGKAAPYGVYDIATNEGYVSVGISHDTAAFAVATIRNWWLQVGKGRFDTATKIFITADGGGSNSSRNRLWKTELQLLADEIRKEIWVSHFPPGTSKWNKIEHRLFSHITMNWRGKPLTSLQVIVDLIAATTTTKGLKVRAQADSNNYEKGIKISDEAFAKINMVRNDFHGEWNYVIRPNFV